MNLLKGHPAAWLAGLEDRDRERARDASYRCNARPHTGPLTVEDRGVISPAGRPSRSAWLKPPRLCLGLGAAVLLTIRNGTAYIGGDGGCRCRRFHFEAGERLVTFVRSTSSPEAFLPLP